HHRQEELQAQPGGDDTPVKGAAILRHRPGDEDDHHNAQRRLQMRKNSVHEAPGALCRETLSRKSAATATGAIAFLPRLRGRCHCAAMTEGVAMAWPQR